MANNFGTFLDKLDAELLPDGQKLKLLDDYRYRDPDSEIWTTPKDWIVDGASFPGLFGV